MVEVYARDVQTEFSEGASFTPESEPRMVVKWCKTTAELSGGQITKAVKLCNHDCIKYAGGGVFLCLPLDMSSEVVFEGVVYQKKAFLKDYNKESTPYVLSRSGDDWACTCQWYTKMNRVCAHILALKIDFKRKKFSGAYYHEG